MGSENILNNVKNNYSLGLQGILNVEYKIDEEN